MLLVALLALVAAFTLPIAASASTSHVLVSTFALTDSHETGDGDPWHRVYTGTTSGPDFPLGSIEIDYRMGECSVDGSVTLTDRAGNSITADFAAFYFPCTSSVTDAGVTVTGGTGIYADATGDGSLIAVGAGDGLTFTPPQRLSGSIQLTVSVP